MRKRGKLIVMGLPLFLIGVPGHAAPAAQELQDAILGRRTFTAEEVAAMDLNGDGALDVADLVVLGNPVVEASFHEGSSVTREGDPGAGVTVDFSGIFAGTVQYRIRALPDGSATTHQAVVNGTTAIIPVPAEDDGVVEDAQTFEVALLESDGYELGSRVFHTLVLEDNDAVWNGSYQNGGLSVHLQLKIVRNEGVVSGALVTDGFGIIPRNGQGSEWPLASIDLDDQHFSAEVGGVLIPPDSSQTGVAMERRFRFEADNGSDAEVVDPAGTIAGRVTEWVSAAAHPYLNRTLAGGSFTLQKRIPIVVVPDPALEPAQN